MDAQKGRASLQDLSDVAAKLGFKSQGYSTTWTQLSKLKIPVILYMPLETGEHFSVLRGISSESVWLADPSSGNRKYSKHQFLEMWTKQSQPPEVAGTGKMLVVLPNQSASALKPRPIINHAFFLTNSLHTADHAIIPSVGAIPFLEGRY